jgi:hypothetical protein
MAIQIPIHLVNQTGPEWDKFVKDAEKAGFAAGNVGKVADNVLKTLIGRQSIETAQKVGKLADSFGKVEDSAGKLISAVKTLNALNITPYGYERYAYRLSGLVSGLGPAGLAGLGAAAVGVAGLTAAFKTFNVMLERNDQQAVMTNRAWKSVGDTFTFMASQTGSSSPFQVGMKAAEILLEDFSIGILGVNAAVKVFGEKGFAGFTKANIDKQAISDLKELHKFRPQELKNQISLAQDTHRAVEQIKDAKTLVELKQRSLALDKEMADEAAKGAFSDRQSAIFKAQMIAMAEKEHELLRRQADDLKTVIAQMQQTVKGRADQFAKNGDGPLNGGLDEFMGGISQDEVMREMAIQMAGGAGGRGRKLTPGQQRIRDAGIAKQKERLAKSQARKNHGAPAFDPATGEQIDPEARGREQREAALDRKVQEEDKKQDRRFAQTYIAWEKAQKTLEKAQEEPVELDQKGKIQRARIQGLAAEAGRRKKAFEGTRDSMKSPEQLRVEARRAANAARKDMFDKRKAAQQAAMDRIGQKPAGSGRTKYGRYYRGLQSGQLGPDQTGRRRTTFRQEQEGELAAGRRKLEKLAKDGTISPLTKQAMSDAFEAEMKKRIEAAAIADEAAALQRGRGSSPIGKGRRASPANRAQQQAEHERNRGNSAPDAGLNQLPDEVSRFAQQQVENEKAQGKLNEAQIQMFDQFTKSIAGEFSGMQTRIRQLKRIMDSFNQDAADRQRAAQAGLAN